MTPSVLMVTGAYYPELSGGGLQARAVVRALAGRVEFSVLTTSADPRLPSADVEDGVPIRRVYVDIRRRWSTITAALRLATGFLRIGRSASVVNVHGFSRKSILLVALARLLRKRFALTLQTGGHDEPAGVKATGGLAYWAFRQADLYLSVSPGLSSAYLAAGLPASRLRQLCNAVDVDRFRPAGGDEKLQLRRELGLPPDAVLVLFVGFFSHDKRPHLLYDAWSRQAAVDGSTLVYVGATASPYAEIEPELAREIRRRAAADGLAERVRFVDPSHTIERYFRAADIYVLPSVREGLPIALLEAMSTGLACIASRIPGSTDTMIADAVDGRLIGIDDADGFAAALHHLVGDPAARARLGAAARRTVVDRYSIQKTAAQWLAVYAELGARP